MCFAPQRRAIFHLSSGQLAPHPPPLASLLFDPPEPQIIGKTQCFATFLTFSRICIFFLLTLSLLLFSLLIFPLLSASALPLLFIWSILSEVWLPFGNLSIILNECLSFRNKYTILSRYLYPRHFYIFLYVSDIKRKNTIMHSRKI